MTITIPLALAIAIAAIACYRYMGLKPWHLLVLVLAFLVYLFLATSAGPEIQSYLNAHLQGGTSEHA